MHKLPRYTHYKDSGLPWIGEIPVHWQSCRNRFLFREVDRRSAHGEEVHLSMSQIHGLVPSKSLSRKSLQSESYAGGKLVEENDLVLNRLKAHLGVFARANQAGVVSPDYTVLRPKGDASVRYCESLFKTPMYVGEFRRRTKGIVEGFWRLYTDDFYNVMALLPPPEEQDQIVAYLRAQDAHIARFIKAKRELIGLLTEQKLRIIDHAVTRGLDASVTLKPSGIEWLGDVPEHWEVQRLKWVCRFSYGDSLSDSVRRQGDIPVYGSNGQVGLHDSANSIAPSIVIGRKGSFGKVNYSGRDLFAIDTTFYVDRTCSKANIRWLYYLLIWCRLDRVSKDSAVPGLDRTDAHNTFVPVCPLAEQELIAAQLDKDTVVVDAAILRVEEEIKLIREYRDRQIADVVTGQVDVRGWQPGPDDVVREEDLLALGGDEDVEPDGDDDDGDE